MCDDVQLLGRGGVAVHAAHPPAPGRRCVCYELTGMRARSERVWAVVEAARSVVADASLVPSLVASTGLSREGVELALARHLEITPTEAEVATLVARTVVAEAVAVVLSANVFVGALRAIAIACAASERVVVRASRRDPAFAEALVAALPGVTLDRDLRVEDVRAGEIHVYGRDATIADVRRRAREGVVVRGHGAGMGVAAIASVESAAALADDVVAFDQRGCLSPRIAFVLGDAAPVAEALHAALACALPRGALSPEERGEGERYAATMAYAGRILAGREHVLGIAAPGAPLVVPPTGRHLHLVPVTSFAEARELLAPYHPAITAIGTDRVEGAVIAPAWARVSALGQMQRPPLDGPVDGRP